jgi:hypothetical protein
VQELVDELADAGDKLVIVEFFAPWWAMEASGARGLVGHGARGLVAAVCVCLPSTVQGHMGRVCLPGQEARPRPARTPWWAAPLAGLSGCAAGRSQGGVLGGMGEGEARGE